MARYCNPECESVGPVCDFCVWYDFNGDARGAYLNRGECVHPAHPHPEDPGGGCEDFECWQAPGVDPDALARHNASQRGG